MVPHSKRGIRPGNSERNAWDRGMPRELGSMVTSPVAWRRSEPSDGTLRGSGRLQSQAAVHAQRAREAVELHLSEILHDGESGRVGAHALRNENFARSRL